MKLRLEMEFDSDDQLEKARQIMSILEDCEFTVCQTDAHENNDISIETESLGYLRKFNHALEPYDQFVAVGLAVSLGMFTELISDGVAKVVISIVAMLLFVTSVALIGLAWIDYRQT